MEAFYNIAITPAVRISLDLQYINSANPARDGFALDVLACPDCGGRVRLVATIADPRVIARILAHLGLPPGPPRPLPPRHPSGLPADAN